jgi:hypothetical protein
MTPRTLARAIGAVLLVALAFYVIDRGLAGPDADSEPATMRDRIAVKAALARRADALRAADSLSAERRARAAEHRAQRRTRDSLAALVELTPTPGIVAIQGVLTPIPVEVTQLLAEDARTIAGLEADTVSMRRELDERISGALSADTAHAIVVDTLTKAVRTARAQTRRAYVKGAAIGAAVVAILHFVFGATR